MKNNIIFAVILTILLIPFICFASSEENIIGITNEGYYIKSENKIFFSKNLDVERTQIFNAENKIYTYTSTEDYFVILTVDEKNDGKAFCFKGEKKSDLDFYPGMLQHKIPQVQSIGGNRIAVLTYEKGEQILSNTMWTAEAQVLNLDKDKYFPLLRQRYAENEKGTVGRVITAFGGSGDTVYIVRSNIPSTEKDVKGSEISKYQINSDNNDILEIERIKVPYYGIYITGNEKYALLNTYNPFKPLNPAGKFLKIKGNSFEEKDIPEISSGNDIIEAVTDDEQILFRVPKALYSLNLENTEISESKISSKLGKVNCVNYLEIIGKER